MHDHEYCYEDDSELHEFENSEYGSGEKEIPEPIEELVINDWTDIPFIS